MASGGDDVFTSDTNQHWEMKRKASFSKLTGAVPRTIPGMYNVVDDPHADDKKEKLWKLMETYLPSDVHSIQRSIVNHVVSRGVTLLHGLFRNGQKTLFACF